ncbi:sulfotransferase family protein [Actinomadura roseirufa]|uniref:sulfotransferase family protein n=1 Tax=Actinomadura roseirufa TaxID=2094049 RepID=UPI0013F167A7|nr:sulfotransferase [Actinomadura roseirufa]
MLTAGTDGRVNHREPVFLLAPARSYSTVVQAMLSGHDGIFGFPEMIMFALPDVRTLLSEATVEPGYPPSYYSVRLSGIWRAIAQIHRGGQETADIAWSMQWLAQRPDWSLTRVFDDLQDAVSPLICLEKSPDTVRTDPALAACARAYPNARFIHLTRHPVDTQRSMAEHLRLLGVTGGGGVAVTAASSWYLGHHRVVRMLDDLPPDRWIRVRAEDLLNRPDVFLPRVVDWLGLPWDEQVVERMKRTEDWTFAGTGPAGDLQGGDWKFFRSPRLREVEPPGPVVFDDEWGLPQEMQRRMRELAEGLGY